MDERRDGLRVTLGGTFAKKSNKEYRRRYRGGEEREVLGLKKKEIKRIGTGKNTWDDLPLDTSWSA